MSGKRVVCVVFLSLWGALPLFAQRYMAPYPQAYRPQNTAVRQAAQAPQTAQTSQTAKAEAEPEPEQETVSWTDDADFLKQFNEACQAAVEQYTASNTAKETEELRQTLKNEVKSLLYQLNRNSNQKNAAGWVKFLQLEELQRMLRSDLDDMALLTLVQERFAQDEKGLERPMFQKVPVALDAYLTAVQSQESDEDRSAFEETKNIVCEDVQALLDHGDVERAEALADSAAYLLELQPNSKPLKTALLLLTRRFAVPNAQMTVSSSIIVPDQAASFTEPTTIKETIRGTATQGKGTVTGMIRPVLVENADRAEIQIQIDAMLEANSTGYNQGVTVQTASTSHLIGKKSIYLTDKTFADPAIVTSSMDAKITGINTGRGNVGSRVAQDRIQQEFPYSKAESKKRAEQRLAERMNKGVDEVLANNSLEKILNFLRKHECPPRGTASSTTADQLKWYGLFGKSTQIGPAQNDETVLNHDFTLKIHESAPSNIGYAILAGRRISDKEFVQWFNSMKANPDTSDAVSETDSEKQLFMTFSKVSPLLIQMSDNKIIVTSCIDEFEQEEKTYPGLVIEFVFALEQDKGQFCLKRQSIDAWPQELERTDSIPARYQAIRTQVLKQLEEGILTEYQFKSAPIKEFSMKPDEKSKEIRGTLTPSEIIIKDGWFLFGADYAPVLKESAK